MEGTERRARKLWRDLAVSEVRLWMMTQLEKLEVGLNDLEAFNEGLVSKLRSEAMKGKSEGIKKKLVNAALQLKIKDEQRYQEEMRKRKNKMRREIGRLLKVNSNPYRKTIKSLNKISQRQRQGKSIQRR